MRGNNQTHLTFLQHQRLENSGTMPWTTYGNKCTQSQCMCIYKSSEKHFGYIGTQETLFSGSYLVETTWEPNLNNQDMNWETIVNGSCTVLNANKSTNYIYRKEYQYCKPDTVKMIQNNSIW